MSEPCSDALRPSEAERAAGDKAGSMQEGGQARGTRPSSAQLKGQWGQALGEQRNHPPSRRHSGCRGGHRAASAATVYL